MNVYTSEWWTDLSSDLSKAFLFLVLDALDHVLLCVTFLSPSLLLAPLPSDAAAEGESFVSYILKDSNWNTVGGPLADFIFLLYCLIASQTKK